ncbi:MAG: aminotransferase class III-fold pyridoxal phosphate-dependent enzyme [Anaerolineales bacterium]
MSLLDHAPAFTPQDAVRFARELYALDAQAKSLPSERDQNFLLRTANGARFVLKIANATEERALLEAQNQVMRHLAKHISFCPRVLPTTNNDDLAAVQAPNGQQHFIRLVTYLPGIPLGEVQRHSDELLYDLGRKMAQLTHALEDFDHPALHRSFHWDLAQGSEIIQKYQALIREPALRETVQRLAARFEETTAPLLPSLRQGIIYNDANDYNLLTGGGDGFYTRNQTIVGLIDFGDMVYSYRLGDLAVAIAYAMLGKPDPLAAAASIVRGYHSLQPLTDNERAALFGLATLRLCMSVCIAADQQARQPHNDYLGISQAPIRETLPKLVHIHPRFAEAVFRDACGLHPFPAADKVTAWLESQAGAFASPLDLDLHAGPVAILDLGVPSPLFSSNPDENITSRLTPRLQAAIAETGATVGVGRYAEARYLPPPPDSQPGDEHPTIHLGMDLFAPPGAPVYASLDGTIYTLTENAPQQENGAVIVLEHAGPGRPTFYTLYGGLSRASLDGKRLGQGIAKGEQLATIGEADANGGWTPHLHFQVITDLLDLGTDFPGLARPSQRKIWTDLSLDPNLILGIPLEKFPPRPPEKEETLAVRRKKLGRNLSISYRRPLKIVRGWKQYLFDDEGRRYLDAYNNVAHVGHCHPRVVTAAQRQIATLNTNTRYLHDNINRYAEKLTSLFDQSLSVCFFVNSGSEANELALRLARTYTGRRDMIVLEHAYHGNTNTLIDISPYKHNGPGGKGTPDWVHIAPIPDDYRGAYKRDDPQAGPQYARHVQEIIAALQAQGRGLAGFIAESLPSVGGQIVPPPGYLAEVYRYMRAAGGLCIVDDVQTGFGRVGAHFWGFEMQGVTPDIVVLGKPIGNGHPLGAVITRPEIADAFNNGMEYFTTFGGNPVSCAVGLEVLNVVLEEGLQQHAQRVGERMLAGLRPFVERYSIVGDVRGTGLFLGVELVRDRDTLEPAAEEAAFVMNRMREHGILLGTDGPFHNVVKIRPPMPFNEENADFLVEVMNEILRAEFD